ncbi:MFS transporter [Peribacillus sp. NPDC097295]|uniref:MFS transporter n=1 Tax=Peribacillus sp. NPDC097295 TaxID=3364402 RepID=UPI00381C4BA8
MEKRKFWSYENKLTAIFFFSIGFVFFDRLAINYLIPFMQEDFSLTNTQIGLVSAALALTWSISGPLGGYISDKAKSKKAVLATFVVLFSVVSLSHGFVGSFAMLFVLRLVMGIVEGPIIPITQSIIAVESSENRRGFNTGFTMNTGNAVFGSFLAPLVIVALANAFDWHTAFYLTIIPGIILSMVILKFVKNPKKLEQVGTSENEKINFKEVIKHRNIWLSIIIFSCFMTFLMAFSIYTPLFLVNVKGVSSSTMSLIMAAFGAGYAIFGIVIPAFSDRLGRKPISIIFGICSILLPFSLIFVDSVSMLMILVFFLSAGSGVGSIVMSAVPVESVPFKFAGVAVGLVIGIGELFGGFLNPILSGMAADNWGLTAPLVISSSAAFLAFLCSFFMIESLPSKVRETEEQELGTSSVTV